MAKKKSGRKAGTPSKTTPDFVTKRLTEGSFILILAGTLFILLSLLTYRLSDPGWSHVSHSRLSTFNSGGQVGAYLADILYYSFGYLAYLLPLTIGYITWVIMRDVRALKSVDKTVLMMRTIGLILTLSCGCGLLNLLPYIKALDPKHSAGGVVGQVVAGGWYHMLNVQGAILALLALFLVGITWLTGFSWFKLIDLIGYYTVTLVRSSWSLIKKTIGFSLNKISNKKRPLAKAAPVLEPTPKKSIPPTFNYQEQSKNVEFKSSPLVIGQENKPALKLLVQEKEAPVSKIKKKIITKGLPQLDLLDKGKPGKPMGGYTHQELEQLSREVEQHLLDFGIQADVVAVHPGPVVTRFELQLAAGVKVSKLTALVKDLARSLSVISVRVVEVIPGKTVVGVELPNNTREIVRLSDVLSSEMYQEAQSPLILALGVDIAGHPVMVDLAKMPHLLVAGTTGSGKSVGINAMILSILFKATPEQVRLIMIDPKMLELSVYDGIPHLLTPVVTDMKDAASALRWCVEEMERRYRLMAALGVRNLAGYNAKVAEAIASGAPLMNPLWKPTDAVDDTAKELEALPYVVVIIDELADLMMVVGKKVEQLIARIAQKARAAGIHMILATQRPSVDVLTGLIKSNIPTRMSFQVSSKIDSRTILDQQGAEQLLGHGDMLYLAPGSGAPLRVHGAFIDDKEVHRVADDWRARGEPNYLEDILRMTSDNGEVGSEESQAAEEDDHLYDQAVEFVIQTRKASISSVQRRLKIGYNRAARMVEEMERTGIVGPLDGGYRDVLVTSITEE
jgi:DNA segregation ATPase FtsK/SpoIIIE, S-DNA-T family